MGLVVQDFLSDVVSLVWEARFCTQDAQKSLSKTKVIDQMIKESRLTKLFIIKPLEKVGYLFFFYIPLSIFLTSEDYRQESKLDVKGDFSRERT